jgi:uncharacterized protein (TIGR03546 family)
MLLIKLIQQLVKALNSEGTPFQVAIGIALGAALGLTPLLNLHNLFITAIAMVSMVSFAGFMLGWAAFVPLGFALDPLFDQLGRALLEAPALAGMWTAWYNAPVIPLTNFYNSVVLGSLVVWILAFLPLVMLFRWSVARYRERVYARLQHTRVFKYVKASKVYNIYRLFRPDL